MRSAMQPHLTRWGRPRFTRAENAQPAEVRRPNPFQSRSRLVGPSPELIGRATSARTSAGACAVRGAGIALGRDVP